MSSLATGGVAPSRALLVGLLAGCSALGPMATNIFLPALPDIRAHFDVPVAATQTTVSFFLFAFAFGILVSGPLADRLGRRPVMVGGMSVLALGSLLAAFAPTIEALVAARVVQALGAAAGLTVSRAVVGDLFRDNDMARMLATLTLAMMMGTTISPWVGGELVTRLGWRSSFWFLCAGAALMAVLCLRLLPETRSTAALDRSSAELLRQSRGVLAQPAFFGYVIQAGVIYAVFVVFISIMPYVMTGVLALEPTDFGLWYLLISAGYFIGNLFVTRYGSRFSAEQFMKWGLGLQFASAALALAFGLMGWWHPAFSFVPQLPLAIGQGLALPFISTRALQLAPGYAGLASSLIGFSQSILAALSVQAMGFAPIDSPLPVLWFCAIASALACASLVWLGRRS